MKRVCLCIWYMGTGFGTNTTKYASSLGSDLDRCGELFVFPNLFEQFAHNNNDFPYPSVDLWAKEYVARDWQSKGREFSSHFLSFISNIDAEVFTDIPETLCFFSPRMMSPSCWQVDCAYKIPNIRVSPNLGHLSLYL